MKFTKYRLNFLSHLHTYLQWRKRTMSAVIVAALSPIFAHANPHGAQVISGQVTIDQSVAGITTVTNSPNAIINWQDFNIAQNEITRFIQQSGQSAVLNRIIGGNPSEILGSLFSNGKVFLINPNGIVFGAGSQIDTQGLLASTLNLSNSDFQKGNFHFIAGSKAGDISNEGIIHAGKDGNIVLIAPNIENNGIIHSEGGKIVLAAGQELVLTSLDDPEIRFQVQAPKNHVLNVGQLLTEGGAINVFAGTLKHSGDISADSVEVDKQGNIRLVAKGEVTLEKDSKTSVNNEKGDAGKIEITGENVAILDNSKIEAIGKTGGGEILVGGDWQGKGDLPQATTAIVESNVKINANATEKGDGGKVVVWSDVHKSDSVTTVKGEINAKGGKRGGDGGKIETSGHQVHAESAKINASAPKGKAGEWLLDPTNLTIDSAYVGQSSAVLNGFSDGTTGWSSSSGFQTCSGNTGGAACIDATNQSLQFSYTSGQTVSKSFSLSGGTALTFNTVVDSSPYSFANTGKVSLSFRDASQNIIGSPIESSVITTSATTSQNINLSNLAIPSGATSVTVTFSQLTSGNGWAGNYGMRFLAPTITTDITSSGSILAALNNGTNFTAQTVGTGAESGDIFVNSPILWGTNTTLTLSAHRNIDINSSISGFGASSKLALEYGQGAVASGNTATYNVHAPVNLPTGQNFSTKLGSDVAATNYTVITSLGVAGDTTSTTLQGMKNALSGNFALGTNIDASGTVSWNSGAGFESVATNPNSFTGNFDGLGHTISNLLINRPATNYVGLFGDSSGKIQNVGLLNVSISGGSNTGGLVGWNHGTSGIVKNSFTTGNVSGGTDGTGGLIGTNSLGEIKNSYSTSNVLGTNSVGGLVGYQWAGNVSNSYSTGSVSGTSWVGGLLGVNNSGSVSSSYSTGSVSGGYATGGLVGETQHNTATGTVTSSFWDTQTSGKSTSSGGTGLTTAQMMAQANFTGFDFTNTWWMSDTNTRPFLRSEWSTTITNAHQLQLMSSNLSANYTLAKNLDLSSELSNASGMWDVTKGFVPVGDGSTPFTGSFDGLNHTINGLTINRPSTNNVGLFSYTSGSTIQNVGLTSGSVIGYSAVGGLIGFSNNNAVVNNSYSTMSVSAHDAVGGLIGDNYVGSILSNSYSTGTVYGLDGAGGLVGGNWGTVSASYSTAAVSGNNTLGGLAGQNIDGTITNSYSTGNVTGTGIYIGGLLGGNYSGTVNNSYSTGAVSGTSNIGGLIGNNTGTVNNSFWDKTINSNASLDNGLGIGLTTVQMQARTNFTNWDFANTWTNGGLNGATPSYPHLLWQGLDKQTISGTVATFANKTLDYAVNGVMRGSVTTDASGNFSVNSWVGSGNLLLWLSGDTNKAATLAEDSHLTGLTLEPNTIYGHVDLDTATLKSAKGSLTDADIPFSFTSSVLTPTVGILKANNDIILNNSITTNGSNVSLKAGKSVLLNSSSISSNGGNIEIIANETTANGIVNSHRDAGQAVIQMQAGSNLDAGLGVGGVAIMLRKRELDTPNNAGAITLTTVTGGNVNIDNAGIYNATDIGSGDVVLNGVITTSNNAVNVKASQNISLAASASITTQGGAVVLNSDSDADGTNGGAIVLNSGSSISTNGGAITLGGGANPLTGYAQGNSTNLKGIILDTTSLSSNGGDISLRGKSATGSSSGSLYFGVYTLGATAINSGTGQILIDGTSIGTGGANDQGVNISSATSIVSNKTTGNAIAIVGNASVAATSLGLNAQGQIIAPNGGDISLTGIGNTSDATYSTYQNGILLANGQSILASTGAISLTGAGRTTGITGDVFNSFAFGAIGQLASSPVLNSSSNITLNADTLNFGNGGTFNSSGILSIQPQTANTTIGIAGGTGTLQLPASYFATNFVNGFSNINIGSTTAGDISIGTTALTYNDPLLLKTAGSITAAANAALTGLVGETNSLTLWASSAGSAYSGNITFNIGSSITTNGGDILFRGGADALTTVSNPVDATSRTNFISELSNTGAGKSANHGINLLGTNINAGGGNIEMRGASDYVGIDILNSTAIRTSGAGSIALYGLGGKSAVSGTAGIHTDNVTIETTGTGDVTLYGVDSVATGGGNAGIWLNNSNVGTHGTAGNVVLTGYSTPTGTLANNEGIAVMNSSVNTTTSNGSITVQGTGGTGTSYNLGVKTVGNIGSGGVINLGTSTGNLNVIGVGGTCSVTGCWGVLAEDGGDYESWGAGNINLTGTAGTGVGTDNYGIKLTRDISHIGSASMTGAITLTADTMDLVGTGTGSLTLQSTGDLTIKPQTASTTIGIAGGTGTLQTPASYFSTNFVNGFSNINIGSATTGAMTLGAALTVPTSANLTLQNANNMDLNGALTLAANKTLTLNSTGNVTQTAPITATNLLLLGAGNYALTNVNNIIANLAANGVGNLGFINNGEFTIGTIGNVSGIEATGKIDIATMGGHLNINDSIHTSDTTLYSYNNSDPQNPIMDAAIKLNADKIATTDTTNNIHIGFINGSTTIRPTITTGTGGTALLLTGSISGTPNLSSLVQVPVGNFRYNSDESVVNFTTPITSGLYAIYREQPLISFSIPSTYSDTYDAQPVSLPIILNNASFPNQDGTLITPQIAQTLGELPSIKIEVNGIQGTLPVNVGTYPITVTPISAGNLFGGLGYGFETNGVSSTVTISPTLLTIAANPTSKTYGMQDPIFTYTPTGLLGSDSITGSLSRNTGENVGTYAINQGTLNAGSNYTISYIPANFTIQVDQAAIDAAAKAEADRLAAEAAAKAEADRLAAEAAAKAEADRLAAEAAAKAEAERLAAEAAAKAEANRLAAEAAAKAEADRLAAEAAAKAEADRLAAEAAAKAEAERLAAEAAAKAEADRLAAEAAAKAEAERLAAEAAAKAEADRLAAEAAAKVEAERLAAEAAAKAEADRLAAEAAAKAEAERLAAEAAAKAEADRLAAEAAAKVEADRLAAEAAAKAEAERLAAEAAAKAEAERLAAEAAAKAEADRLAAEASAKAEAERLAAEAAKAEAERLAAEAAAKAEAERLAAEAAAKAEADRLAAEAAAKAEAERLAAEAAAKAEAERLAAEVAAKAEAERLAAEAAAKAEAERLAAEAAAKAEAERLAAEAAAKAEADRLAAEAAAKAEAERLAAEAAAKAEADRLAAEAVAKAEAERLAAEILNKPTTPVTGSTGINTETIVKNLSETLKDVPVEQVKQVVEKVEENVGNQTTTVLTMSAQQIQSPAAEPTTASTNTKIENQGGGNDKSQAKDDKKDDDKKDKKGTILAVATQNETKADKPLQQCK